MDDTLDYLGSVDSRMDAAIAEAWRNAELSMTAVAGEWSTHYPNHFVYIEEAMGSLFMHVYRVGRSSEKGYVDVQDREIRYASRGTTFSIPYRDSLAEILLPLQDLYNALLDASDRVRIAVDFHCLYRGERQSYEWFKKATNNGGVQ